MKIGNPIKEAQDAIAKKSNICVIKRDVFWKDTKIGTIEQYKARSVEQYDISHISLLNIIVVSEGYHDLGFYKELQMYKNEVQNILVECVDITSTRTRITLEILDYGQIVYV